MVGIRLKQQISFIVEIDRVKQIYRQNYVIGADRHENDAEHSWHLAVMAILLAEHVKSGIDVTRVVKMVLIHDLVEIDAGDTYCYDEKGCADKDAREQRAADRLFGMLPPDQQQEFRVLWEEFEAAETPEARFAAALDRLQPLLLHYKTGGRSWHSHGITSGKVIARNRHTKDIAPEIGELIDEIIKDAVDKGFLPR